MSEPRWLTVQQAVLMHAEQLALFGGPAGLRDVGLLEAAIDRPRNKWAYGEREMAALAASYAFGFAKNHPFVDGNKRAAFMAMTVFLLKNEVAVEFPQGEAVARIIELAAGAIGERELAVWIADEMA